MPSRVVHHACPQRGAAFPMDFALVLRDVRLADAKPDQPATDIGVRTAASPRSRRGWAAAPRNRCKSGHWLLGLLRIIVAALAGARGIRSLGTTHRANSIRHILACLR